MKARTSELELLRVVAMVLIILTHLCVWGVMKTDNALPWQQEIAGVTNAVIRWHVNVFIIITGYFGIKSRLGIIKVVTISLFYTWVLYAIECLFCEVSFSFTTIIKSLFFVSHNKYWFVQSYILLMLLAPFN